MFEVSPYMTVKEAAAYLQLNEKKVYQLASHGHLPATKVTGKWLFPRKLIDRWLLESSHHGVLSDRLLLAGSDDPLLRSGLLRLMQAQQYQRLYSYMPTGTQAGLSLLAQGLTDACAIHWGPAAESSLRHPGLIRHYQGSRHWVLVHLYKRQQGLMLGSDALVAAIESRDAEQLKNFSWVFRQEGAGSQRFLKDWLLRLGVNPDQVKPSCLALTEQETAAAIRSGRADLGPGAASAALEAGLHFVPIYEEAFELVLPRPVFFRKLLQNLFDWLQTQEGRQLADQFQGYDLSRTGRLVWTGEEPQR